MAETLRSAMKKTYIKYPVRVVKVCVWQRISIGKGERTYDDTIVQFH